MLGPILFLAFMALVAFIAKLARAAGVVERILHDPDSSPDPNSEVLWAEFEMTER